MPKAKSKSRTSAKLKRRKPVQCSAMVRPQWAIGQTVRHKLTGELFAVEAINDDYADLRPLISKITVTKWGFSHWEASENDSTEPTPPGESSNNTLRK